MTTLIEVDKLSKNFAIGGGKVVHAVDEVSLAIAEKEILGLVGESGSGKSTLGKAMVGLHDKTSGQVIYRGEVMPQRYRPDDFQHQAQRIQMIFQDPYSSLNPRMTSAKSSANLARYSKLKTNEIRARVADWLRRVGLNRIICRATTRVLRRSAATHRHRARSSWVRVRRLRTHFALDVSVQAQSCASSTI
jgi:ABC-type oligopeptide transport system ATPase subunit